MSGWFAWRSGAASFGLIAVAVLSGAGQQAAAQGAKWGARDPVKPCPEITSSAVPPADAIARLFRCERESITATDELWLVEDLSVRAGSGRRYLGRDELMTMPDANTAKSVYPLRGSWTWVSCRDPKAVARTGGNPSLNCSQARVEKAEGACWMTTFGNWRCNMTGSVSPSTIGHPPPR